MSKKNLIIALAVAIAADMVQVVFFPLFIGGVFMPWDDAIDFVVAGVMTWLLGWHWVFLPTAAAKLVPVVDMAPYWTLAVFYVAMRHKKELDDPNSEMPTLPSVVKQAQITTHSSQP